MKVRFYTILIAFFLIFSNSCSSLKEFVSVEKPTLSLSDFNVEQLTLSDIDLLFDINIDNPNPIAVSVNSYSYSFLIANQQFVSGNQETSTDIPATSSNVIQVPVSFGYQELYDTFEAIRDQDETNFTFEGVIAVEVPIFGIVELPYSQSGKIPVVKRPSIRVQSMKVRDLSLSKIALDFNFEIENPNAFAIDLSGFSYDLNINQLKAINGTVNEQVSLGSKSTNTLSIPLEINVLQAGMGIYRAISNRESFEFTFSGDATLGTDLPYFKSSTFNFSRSGSVDIPN